MFSAAAMILTGLNWKPLLATLKVDLSILNILKISLGLKQKELTREMESNLYEKIKGPSEKVIEIQQDLGKK